MGDYEQLEADVAELFAENQRLLALLAHKYHIMKISDRRFAVITSDGAADLNGIQRFYPVPGLERVDYATAKGAAIELNSGTTRPEEYVRED